MPIGKVLAIRGDGWSHVTIDNMTIGLLGRSSREHVWGGLDLDRLARWCWRACDSGFGGLFGEELLEGDGH